MSPELTLEAEGFELVDVESQVKLDKEVAYLAVRVKPAVLTGQVFDADGRPAAQAQLALSGYKTETDPDGLFSLTLPANLGETDRMLSIVAPGHAPWRSLVTPGGNPMLVRLVRQQ